MCLILKKNVIVFGERNSIVVMFFLKWFIKLHYEMICNFISKRVHTALGHATPDYVTTVNKYMSLNSHRASQSVLLPALGMQELHLVVQKK